MAVNGTILRKHVNYVQAIEQRHVFKVADRRN